MTTAPTHAPARQGALERWARFSHRHRWQVVVAWVVVLVGLFAANFVFGGTYVSGVQGAGYGVAEGARSAEGAFPGALRRYGRSGLRGARGRNERVRAAARAGGHRPDREDRRRRGSAIAVRRPALRLERPDDRSLRSGLGDQRERHQVLGLDEFSTIVDRANGDGLKVEAGGHVVAENEQTAFGSEVYGLLAAVFILLDRVRLGHRHGTAHGRGDLPGWARLLDDRPRHKRCDVPGVQPAVRGDDRHRRRHRLQPADRDTVPRGGCMQARTSKKPSCSR